MRKIVILCGIISIPWTSEYGIVDGFFYAPDLAIH